MDEVELVRIFDNYAVRRFEILQFKIKSVSYEL